MTHDDLMDSLRYSWESSIKPPIYNLYEVWNKKWLDPWIKQNEREKENMETREMMNRMKKGMKVEIADGKYTSGYIEAFDYVHLLVGIYVDGDARKLRWVNPKDILVGHPDPKGEPGKSGCDGYKIHTYICDDIEMTKRMVNAMYGIRYSYPKAKKIVYDEAAGVTVVLWNDGTKTVVKAAEGEVHDSYHGYCVALAKKLHGTNSALKREIDKLVVYQGKKPEKSFDTPDDMVTLLGKFARKIYGEE